MLASAGSAIALLKGCTTTALEFGELIAHPLSISATSSSVTLKSNHCCLEFKFLSHPNFFSTAQSISFTFRIFHPQLGNFLIGLEPFRVRSVIEAANGSDERCHKPKGYPLHQSCEFRKHGYHSRSGLPPRRLQQSAAFGLTLSRQ